MEKLIDGKLYDTDNATLLASAYPNGTQDRSNFHFLWERLYVTENGRYFVAGEGGAKTRYSKPAATGGVKGGEDIRSLSAQEAFEWCQQHDKVEAAREHFTEHIEAA